jgi:hypothetical protein
VKIQKAIAYLAETKRGNGHEKRPKTRRPSLRHAARVACPLNASCISVDGRREYRRGRRVA